MKASGRGLTAGRDRFSLRRTLVVVQVALSLVLVAGALLFTRSLSKLANVNTGFQQDEILIARADLRRLNLAEDQRVVFRAQLLERLKAIPGVEAASETTVVPLSGEALNNDVWIDGQRDRLVNSSFSWVAGAYFDTLRTPLIAGRDFNSSDTTNSVKVAVINGRSRAGFSPA
jgi:hypothetical protein